MLDDLIIYQKTYDLILWFFPIINKFPKKQRFVLGQQIENELLEIIKDIISANNERNKTEILKRISVRLDTLRILVRLAKDLRFLSIKHYENAAVKINEIGKLLSGWMKKFTQ
jgi:four helix bundle protein